MADVEISAAAALLRVLRVAKPVELVVPDVRKRALPHVAFGHMLRPAEAADDRAVGSHRAGRDSRRAEERRVFYLRRIRPAPCDAARQKYVEIAALRGDELSHAGPLDGRQTPPLVRSGPASRHGRLQLPRRRARGGDNVEEFVEFRAVVAIYRGNRRDDDAH